MTIKRLLRTGNHTCLGALQDFDPSPTAEGELQDGPGVLHRRVCIVYPGTFQSLDGPVEITEENVRSLAGNYNSIMMRAKRLVTGEVPLRDCAPIQADHSELATNTVGRLVGPLEVALYEVPGQSPVYALFGTAKILGEENCQKVKDGRWTHVSLGADLDTNKINEISITPFPAAPHAALLRKDTQMAEGAQKPYRDMTDSELDIERKEVESQLVIEQGKDPESGTAKLMKEKLDQVNAEFKKRGDKTVEMAGSGTGVAAPGSATGMETDDPNAAAHHGDAGKKTDMAAMIKLMEDGKHDECLAKMKASMMMAEPVAGTTTEMSAEESDKSQEVVDPVAPKDPTHLARRDRLVKLVGRIITTNAAIVVEEKRAKVSARLSALKASGKITPAEIKKVDIVRLAATNDVTIDAVMASYESREPVILVGVYGNSNAPDVAALVKDAKKSRMSRLESESRARMTSVPGGERMSEGNTDEDAGETEEKRMAAYEDHEADDKHAEMGAVIKLMEEGKHEEALAKMKACAMCMNHAKMYGDANLTSMAAEVAKLREHCGELMKLAAETLQVPENELA